MIVLGIESTAHTFGVGIVKNKDILANAKKSYTTKSGGMIPVRVGEHHIKVCDSILKKALKQADLSMKDIDAVAFSIAPGLGHSLRVGAVVARTLALKYDKPLIGVNHAIAHLEIGRMLSGMDDPILLYASGANTQVIAYEAGKYRVFGETLDIGVGNFLDSFARFAGLGFPGGPKIEKLAKKSSNYIELPYVVKGMDVSFGGLLTNLKNKHNQGKYALEDLSYSAQETVFAMLVETAERAMAHTGKEQLVLGGGVACNKRFQQMCRQMCKDRKAKFYVPKNEFLVDNGAMIAWTGLLMYEADETVKVDESAIRPYERTDEVSVTWR